MKKIFGFKEAVIKKGLILAPVFLFFFSMVYSQQGCQNGDFESGNFSNWKCYTGTLPGAVYTEVQPVQGRHTMINDPTLIDTNTCNQLTMIAPSGSGGAYGVRLGNYYGRKQTEKLEYTIPVSAQNAIFSFRYAVVLQKGLHPSLEQAYFMVVMRDASNNIIPCGNIKYVADDAGFSQGDCVPLPADSLTGKGGVIFKPWSTHMADLSAYIGQNVKIEFITADCTHGGHWCYAYIDGICEQPLITGNYYCTGDANVTINAPAGFPHYKWSNNATTASITVPAVDNQSYSVLVSTDQANTCQVSLSTQLHKSSVSTGFKNGDTFCLSDSIEFVDTSKTNGDIVYQWLWEFGDGTTSALQNPKHKYDFAGSKNIRLTVTTLAGCTFTMNKNILITTPASVIISGSGNTICKGDSIKLTASATGGGNSDYKFTWQHTTDTSRVIMVKPDKTTVYTVSALADSGGCPGTQKYTIFVTQPLDSPIMSCADADISSIKFSWTPVNNASGYEVSTDGINFKTPSSGSSGTTHLITGLMPDVAVRLYVRAKGNTFICKNNEAGSIICRTLKCPSLELKTVSDVIRTGNTVQVDIKAEVGNGSGTFLYHWTPDIGNGPGPYTVSSDMDSVFSVIVQDVSLSSCPALLDTIKLNFYNYYFRLPDVFLPGKAGEFEFFKPDYAGVTTFEMKVFDRWGVQVFQSKDIANYWNGCFNNNPSMPLSAGTYIYMININNPDGSLKNMKGIISLSR